MAAPRAETLFHFTKSLGVLKLILANGFAPRFCLEDVDWQGWDKKHIAYAMTCFCDIPLSRIGEHTEFYGKYGLGMTKEWGLKNGLNPVVYFPPNGFIPQLANFLLASNFDESVREEELNTHSFQLLKLMKPIRGAMIVSGKPVEKDFYQESEWRYAPDEFLLYEEDFDSGRDKANAEAEVHSVRFTPSDVRYIFVPDDTDIPALCDFITTQMANYPLADLKILQTRIVSLAQVAADV